MKILLWGYGYFLEPLHVVEATACKRCQRFDNHLMLVITTDSNNAMIECIYQNSKQIHLQVN